MKLSFRALTSLKKSKERPSATQSPRDRLSAEIERYIRYPVIDGDENPNVVLVRQDLSARPHVHS